MTPHDENAPVLLIIIRLLILLLVLLASLFDLFTVTAAGRRAGGVFESLLVVIAGLLERLAVATVDFLPVGVVGGDDAGQRGFGRRVVGVVVVGLVDDGRSGRGCMIRDRMIRGVGCVAAACLVPMMFVVRGGVVCGNEKSAFPLLSGLKGGRERVSPSL